MLPNQRLPHDEALPANRAGYFSTGVGGRSSFSRFCDLAGKSSPARSIFSRVMQRINEPQDVLGRPALREHYGVALHHETVSQFIGSYRALATLLPRVPPRLVLQSDPNDSFMVDLAIAADAD